MPRRVWPESGRPTQQRGRADGERRRSQLFPGHSACAPRPAACFTDADNLSDVQPRRRRQRGAGAAILARPAGSRALPLRLRTRQDAPVHTWSSAWRRRRPGSRTSTRHRRTYLPVLLLPMERFSALSPQRALVVRTTAPAPRRDGARATGGAARCRAAALRRRRAAAIEEMDFQYRPLRTRAGRSSWGSARWRWSSPSPGSRSSPRTASPGERARWASGSCSAPSRATSCG